MPVTGRPEEDCFKADFKVHFQPRIRILNVLFTEYMPMVVVYIRAQQQTRSRELGNYNNTCCEKRDLCLRQTYSSTHISSSAPM